MFNSFCYVCFFTINFTMKVDSILLLLSVVSIVISLIAVTKMNQLVPDPYMDEIFHYPMTKRYFEGISLSCI